MRNCTNCVWSVSQKLEKETKGSEEKTTTMKVGDCCLSKRQKNTQQICNSHLYLNGSDECEYHLYYDQKNNEHGYLIVGNYMGYNIKFLKIVASNAQTPIFKIYGYEKPNYNNSKDQNKEILFIINKKDAIYPAFKKFQEASASIIDSEEQEKIKAKKWNDNIELTLCKNSCKFPNSKLNIALKINNNCAEYYQISKLYQDLEAIYLKTVKKEEKENLHLVRKR